MIDTQPNGVKIPGNKSFLPGAEDLNSRLEKADRRIEQLQDALYYHIENWLHAHNTIGQIHGSTGWRWLHRYYRVKHHLIKGTWAKGVKNFGEVLYSHVNRVFSPLLRHLHVQLQEPDYWAWIRHNEPGPAELEQQKQQSLPVAPLVSIVVSVDAPETRHFRTMLDSVLGQTYAFWELLLVGTPADSALVQGIVDEAQKSKQNIRVIPAPDGWDTSYRYNQALAAATGELVAPLNQHDVLAPFALFEIVRALNESPDADFVYSDEDVLNESGGFRRDPHFKPDWSPDTFRSHNYIGNFTVLRRRLIERAGGFRTGLDDPRHYDLLLRASEQAQRIVHVPKVLYHARPPAEPENGLSRRCHVEKKALAEHLGRLGLKAQVRDGLRAGTYQVAYRLLSRPKVSVIIPNKDEPATLLRCMRSLRKCAYQNFEVIIAENNSRFPETFACYDILARDPNTRIMKWNRPFNYAAVNNFAARHARGDVLLFLNNDTEAINPDWMERMVEHAVRPDVGAVGAKLYYPDDTIQHAGAIVGLARGIHYQRFMERDSSGYANRLITTQNLSAITGACLMTRREVFEEIGGFDETFIMLYNDIDLCLKIREKGYLIVWSPFAELYHYECVTRGYARTTAQQARDYYEHVLYHWKWRSTVDKGDCYYNPNLTASGEDCALNI